MLSTAIPTISQISCRGQEAKRHVLIYFICGNPGLVEYYRHFLRCLCTFIELADPNASTAYDIYGRNLPGFSDEDHDAPFSAENPPWGLEAVIEDTYEDVIAQRRSRGGKYDEAILMGHSVGAFIGVEIFHRHLKHGDRRAPDLKLTHGFLLFPTITHIALSRSGQVFTTLTTHVPLLERHAHVFARVLLRLIPSILVLTYLKLVGGFSDGAAQTTLGWLKSRDGVWQTLWLARDEMKMILGDERWGEEIWEVEQEKGEEREVVPRFSMFYGKKDHWVADSVRDEFVERMKMKEKERGTGGGKGTGPRIEIDEGNLPHAFCTRDGTSYEVAKRVSEWIAEIEEARTWRTD